MMRSFFCLAISAATGLAQAAPPNVEVEFDLSCNGRALAEVVERLERSGDRYELTETWKGKGLYALLGKAKRVSRGSIGEDGLRPAEFADERSGRDTARAWFDWKAKTVTMQYKGDRHTEPMPPNTQDRLSFLLALTLLPGRAQSISFSIFDGRGQSRHEYEIGGRERLVTPAGEFDTVKVQRRYEPGATDRAEIWLAPEYGHLPVRLLAIEKDGTRCEHVAKRITRS
jgi:uncharacterized protein DUF3108